MLKEIIFAIRDETNPARPPLRFRVSEVNWGVQIDALDDGGESIGGVYLDYHNNHLKAVADRAEDTGEPAAVVDLYDDVAARRQIVTKAGAAPLVIVTIQGGVAEIVERPDAVAIEIHDYDNAKGLAEDEIDETGHTAAGGYAGHEYGVDESGNVYQRARYGPGP